MDDVPASDPLELARGRSPGEGWRRVAYGLHRREVERLDAEELPADPVARRDRRILDLWAWQEILRPTACFTHLTSAAVRGWWLPPLPDGVPVWIAQTACQNPTRRRGARVIRVRGQPASELVGGVRLASAAETLVTSATDLCLLDVVVLLDAALRAGDATPDQIAGLAAERRRGAPRLRRALALADGRSESPWETILRLLHVTCGVDVVPQQEIRVDGRFVARADLWLRGTNAIHEYDGGEHLRVARQRSDLQRSRRLAEAHVVRRGYTAKDVADHSYEIIREAYASLGRPFTMEVLRPWWDLWSESAFTPAGVRRLAERWSRPSRG